MFSVLVLLIRWSIRENPRILPKYSLSFRSINSKYSFYNVLRYSGFNFGINLQLPRPWEGTWEFISRCPVLVPTLVMSILYHEFFVCDFFVLFVSVFFFFAELLANIWITNMDATMGKFEILAEKKKVYGSVVKKISFSGYTAIC